MSQPFSTQAYDLDAAIAAFPVNRLHPSTKFTSGKGYFPVVKQDGDSTPNNRESKLWQKRMSSAIVVRQLHSLSCLSLSLAFFSRSSACFRLSVFVTGERIRGRVGPDSVVAGMFYRARRCRQPSAGAENVTGAQIRGRVGPDPATAGSSRGVDITTRKSVARQHPTRRRT